MASLNSIHGIPYSRVQTWTGKRILIVGNPELIHIGSHLYKSALALNLPVKFCDTRIAFRVNSLVLRFHWHILGHRPPRLRLFGKSVVETCRTFQPHWLLATGIAPLDALALEQIHDLGIQSLNFLTDDPWSHSHRAAWFMHALPHYDRIFSPRRANLKDLAQIGCPNVYYLPFAYAPDQHYPDAPATVEEQRRFECEMLFYGGGDRDRLPYIEAIIQTGLKVHLYGAQWERFSETRKYTRGEADPQTLRKAVGGAKVTLCLVRHSNRDGHVMRTFEAPAMGACMLVEDTVEHREIFGEEGDSVIFFSSIEEMVKKLFWLLEHDQERCRLAQAVHSEITNAPNTYRDRLVTMLSTSSGARKGR